MSGSATPLARTMVVAVVATVALSGAAWACPVCYGEAQGPLIDAARLGAWLLIGVVAAMWVGFVSFFVYLGRRARRFRNDPALATAPATGAGSGS